MAADRICDEARAELSTVHDEGGPLTEQTARHVAGCPGCSDFAAGLGELDQLLARGHFEKAPDLSPAVMSRIAPRRGWWAVAVAAAVGILTGALIGGIGTSLERVRAGDLGDLFYSAGPSLDALGAEMLIVERGWHPDVPERVYVGSLAYTAPEDLEISLIDTTRYPGPEWEPNDVLLQVADGDYLLVASSRCPIAALPGCLEPPVATAVTGRRPFAEGVPAAQEVVGPGRILTRWGGVEVLAAPLLEGRPTIQIETTVAGSDLVRVLTDRGAWREFHPTDRVLMWLDEETLVPVRTEVFATRSPERDLWELRRGYRDDGEDPILIIEVDLSSAEPQVSPDLPRDAVDAGFVDGAVEIPEPVLDAGLTAYRSGRWLLPDGAEVELASWSDGRSWLRVEATEGWDEPRLFGMAGPFSEPVDLGGGSVGFLSPDGSSLAVHGEEIDVLLTGTLPVERLVEAAASLPVHGLEIPPDWDQAAVVQASELPGEILVPRAEGWSALGFQDGDGVTLLLTGAGRRAVQVTQRPGDRLDPPGGPDFFAVELDGTTARFDASAQVLEWVENGVVVTMQSETVGLADLIALAASMSR